MIDWQQVTLNLRSNYKPLSVIAKEIGASHSGLRDLSLGRHKSPRFDTGIKLLDLHYDKVPHLHKISVIGKP